MCETSMRLFAIAKLEDLMIRDGGVGSRGIVRCKNIVPQPSQYRYYRKGNVFVGVKPGHEKC